MRSVRSSVVPFVVFALAACSADSTAPSRQLPLADAPSLNNGNGVVVSLTGAGVINVLSGGLIWPGDFQVVAIRRADGTVTGHFRQSVTVAAGLVEFEGVVTCVTTDPAFPERARVGGVVTVNNSTHPSFVSTNHEVGDDVWFRIESTGSGADGGDKSTTLGFSPTLVTTSADYCALPFTGLHNGQNVWNPASIFPLAQGQITLRDAQ